MHPSIRSPLVLSLAWLAACGGNDDGETDTDGGTTGDEPFDVLVDTVIIPRGDATCPAGGVTLRTGYDDGEEGGTSGDGLLQDGEVDASTTICNGQSGTLGEPGGTLLRYEPVAPGEEGCDDGGVSIFVGDDASGDGELQEGEILSTTIVCADEDPFNTIPDAQAPGTPAGAASIDLRGGAAPDGGAANGGQGGRISAFMVQPGNAFLRAHTTGAVDTSFTVPNITHDFGSNKLTISSDTTIQLGSTGSTSATYPDGTLFIADNRLFERDGGSDVEVTGLEVQSGATLTLDGDPLLVASALIVEVPGSTTSFNMSFSDSVLIDGDVEFDADWIGSNLDLNAALLEINGTIDASAPNGRGGITLRATRSSVFGTLVVTGELDASADTSGEGGTIRLEASRNLFFTGTAEADASAASSGEGFNGGGFSALSYAGPAHVSGTISVNGGDAGGNGGFDPGEGWNDDPTGDAGRGGGVFVQAGRIVFSADVDANGGDASSSCDDRAACDGGDGGDIYLQASDFGGVDATGTWTLNGGDGIAEGDGGDGGEGSILVGGGSTGVIIQRFAGAGLHFGATLTAIGGLGGTADGSTDSYGGDGGNGGNLYLLGQFFSDPTAELALLGVTGIDVGGGNGHDDGGTAGELVAFTQAPALNGVLDAFYPTGITWDVPVDGVGGNGTEGSGGRGGAFFVAAEPDTGRSRNLWITADLDLNGGNGLYWGGEGGGFYASTQTGDANITGTFNGNGGSATIADAGDGYGGFGGEGDFLIGGELNLGLTTNQNGGDANGYGGDGGRFSAEAGLITWTGTCSLEGGDGTSADGYGGWGGEGAISSIGGSSVATGTASVSGGSGGSNGEDGEDGPFAVDGLPY